MAKLSGPMSDALSDLASYGVFQTGTRPQTITALVSRGLVIKTGDDNYSLTDLGRAELGITKAVTLIADNTPNVTENAPLADWEAELFGINTDRPYMVEMLYENEWIIIPGTDSRTWGRANVLRMRIAHKRNANVRIVNIVEDRICA